MLARSCRGYCESVWVEFVVVWCRHGDWRSIKTAIWVTAMVSGLADLEYFIYIDLGAYANFVPGTVMTTISSAAIILSFIAYHKITQQQAAG